VSVTTLRYLPIRSDHLPKAIDNLIGDGTVGPVSVECIVDGSGKMESNLLETWDTYFLQLSVPGVDQDRLHIEVVDRQVMVSGSYRVPAIDEAASIWEHIASGRFYEVFRLPGPADGESTRAEYDRGILTVTLPKVVSHTVAGS
jgi:HSP20 family molecular chaperone IbpA